MTQSFDISRAQQQIPFLTQLLEATRQKEAAARALLKETSDSLISLKHLAAETAEQLYYLKAMLQVLPAVQIAKAKGLNCVETVDLNRDNFSVVPMSWQQPGKPDRYLNGWALRVKRCLDSLGCTISFSSDEFNCRLVVSWTR